jgi:glyoxylase-like metal-dependent hydrolase (beta-lactamase superfamily II)
MRDLLPMPADTTRALDDVAPRVSGLRILMVNVYAVANGSGSWALIDAGLYFSANRIRQWAATHFGSRAPECILLTHGHFDHVGSLRDLADFWNVPVYAHAMERPYLTGASKYPPPDPSVGGGAMAWMAGLYPRGPIDIGDRLRNLPADNTVPGLEGWRWIPTPGHSPGHVSFFRDEDRVLIAGDAFVTTKQESMMAVIEQRPEMHGPPAYFTPDWDAARLSVGRLAALQPAVVATGHGVPMVGPRMEDALDFLAENFDDIARPTHGRYVRRPATMDERGVITLPPPSADPLRMTMLGVAAAIAITFAIKRSRS